MASGGYRVYMDTPDDLAASLLLVLAAKTGIAVKVKVTIIENSDEEKESGWENN